MLNRRRLLAIVLTGVSCLAMASSALRVRAAETLPGRLSDKEFWTLSEELSEPGGSFRSDNFVSNERTYQYIIPGLISTARAGAVYFGVGPEQNFPYIVALKPHMAFIIDVRRGNLHEHLIYKALFEMSADRAEFLSLLFSRPRPAGLGAKSTVAELFAAYDAVQPTEAAYAANFKRITDLLTRRHQFALSADDITGLEYVYHGAFFVGGPNLGYSMGAGRIGGGGNSPTYRELMLAEDGRGHNLGYLANEANFAVIKDLETKNLLVPVVGNFGGPKAIRAVGRYVRDHGGTVEAFYLSNVEQYLIQDDLWNNFCASVATLPLDEASTFIYSGRGGLILGPGQVGPGPINRGPAGFFGGRGGLQSATRPMLREAQACASTSR